MRSELCGGGAAVGERQEQSFQLSFNGSLRVDGAKPDETFAKWGRLVWEAVEIGGSKRKFWIVSLGEENG
jgi:hypothetical protein